MHDSFEYLVIKNEKEKKRKTLKERDIKNQTSD